MNTSEYGENRESAPQIEERVLSPRADVIEDKEGVTLWLDLPGVEESSLEITVEKDILTVSARRQVPSPEGVELRRRELANGLFRRSFTLSEELDGEKVDAEFKNGVLALRILKSERVKPRKIQIKAAH